MRASPSVLIALVAAAEIILICVTWPLWFVSTEYPQVALIPIGATPIAVDQFLAIMLTFSCAVTLMQQSFSDRTTAVESSDGSEGKPPGRRILLAPSVALFCALALAILDQHRLQPWHWLTILLLTEWLLLPRKDFVMTARATLASIYLFAALSRFGLEIDSGMSRQILRMIVDFVGLGSVKVGSNQFFVLSVSMNVAEFCVGLGLLFRVTRRIAIIAACLLHLTLLLCLSPIGLNHHAGVLIWNLFLPSAVVAAFWSNAESDSVSGQTLKGRLVTAALFLFPASGLFGVADNWLSWQVYSPRPETLTLTIDQNSVQFLPETLRPFVQPPMPLQTESVIRIDRWSLDCKYVPVYPEDRFQIAVAREVIERSIANGAAKGAFRGELERPTLLWWRREKINIQF